MRTGGIINYDYLQTRKYYFLCNRHLRVSGFPTKLYVITVSFLSKKCCIDIVEIF